MHTRRSGRFAQIFVFLFFLLVLGIIPLQLATHPLGRLFVRLTILLGVFLSLAYVASLIFEALWKLSSKVSKKLVDALTDTETKEATL